MRTPSYTRAILAVLAALVALLVMPALAEAVTVSGTAMTDELGTSWQGCDGTTANLAIAVNGTRVGSTTCASSSGTFSFAGISIPAVGARVTIWLDGAPSRGVLYTTAASTTADITGLTPTQDRVWLRSEQGGATLTTATFDWTKADDADVPVVVSGSALTIEGNVEIHLGGGVTFRPSGTVDANSIHATTGTTYDGAAGQTTMRGTGTQGCATGPDIARPLCIEGSFAGNGRVVYWRQNRDFTIETVQYGSLLVAADPGATGMIGYASGQTLRVEGPFEAHSSLASDPFAADVFAKSIWINGWANNGGGYQAPRWSGMKPFTITFEWSFDGGAALDLPGATVRGNLVGSRTTFGPTGGQLQNPDWNLRSVILRGQYWRWPFGSGATGMTTPTTSAGSTRDRVVALAGADWQSGYEIIQLAQNGGDWGIIKYSFDGQPDSDWDDGDLNSVDDDGDALLAFNSGGTAADVPWVAALDPATDRLLVGGSSAGNWMLRRYDTHGRLDTSFNGTGVVTSDLGGADEIRGLVWTGDRMAVAGSGGSTPSWRFRTYSDAGVLGTDISWSNGGVAAEVRAMCSRNGPGTVLYVVGRAGAAGSGDWAVKRVSADWNSWMTFGAAGAADAWTWNPGGSEDEATACAAETADNVYVAGTTGNGTDDDGRVRAFWDDGNTRGEWGSAGTVSFGVAGDDEVHDLSTDFWGDSITVAGRDPGNAGQAVVRRYDADGEVDTTWGDNGRILWDGGATTNEVATSLFWDGGQYLRVGLETGTNGGDAATRRYDFSGHLMDSSTPGTARVLLRNSWYERSRLVVDDTFQIGDAADSSSVLVDAQTQDLRVEVNSVLNVTSKGAIRASSAAPLVAGGHVYLDGGFTPNLGELRLVSQSTRATMRTAASTQLHDLTIQAAEKQVAFDPVNPVRVKGRFLVRGSSCAQPVSLRSTTASAWTLDLAGGGTADVQYAEIGSGTASPAATATDSRSLGGNTNWTISGCGGSAFQAPDSLQVDGVTHAQAIGTANPTLSWINRAGATADRADVEVYSSPPAAQVALWRLDGDGADAAGNGWTLTPAAGASWQTGRFGQAGRSTATFDGFSGGDIDLGNEFAVDGWFRRTETTAEAWPDLVYKGDAGRTAVNYRVGFDTAGGRLEGMATLSGEVARVSVPASDVTDGSWHHIALVLDSGRLTLYVDGQPRASQDTWNVTVDQGAWPVRVGYRAGGDLDDWRLASRSFNASEIRGFYRTGRRHADLIWDLDPGDVSGSLLASPVANDARTNITYGGVAGSLRLGGARYWARARFRTQSTTTWSNWSEVDWWEMDQSITATVATSPSVTLGGGPVQPQSDAVGQATFEVTTTNFHGYTAWIEGPSDTWAMSDGLPGSTHELPGIGTPGTTSSWPAGTSGYFGISVLSATGGKDTSRWGTGTSTGDLNALKWGWGAPSNRLLLVNRTAYDPAVQQIVTAFRANVPATQDPGRYTTTMVFTAVPNV